MEVTGARSYCIFVVFVYYLDQKDDVFFRAVQKLIAINRIPK